jgi:hypothetical protein
MSPISTGGKVALKYSSVALPFDSDALVYIEAVEAADGQPLEDGINVAIQSFVAGCKADGIWDDIKACCILAGARTLAGALVPLKGTAPTNNNFVDADYNRETGLVGDASTKYLASNYAFPTSLRNNCHVSGYFSSVNTTGTTVGAYGDSNASGTFLSAISARLYQQSNTIFNPTDTTTAGFRGISRNNSSSFVYRHTGTNQTANRVSLAVTHQNQGVFARRRNTGSYDAFSDGRLSFYSLGESLDLALLDSRVSTLMTDIGAAIP